MTDLPETIHACPPEGSDVMPCCGRTPFEAPRIHRISSDPAAVTCSKPTPTALRDRYAAAIYEYNNPGHRWADAHPDDRLSYGGDADAALAVRDRELEQLRTELAMQKGISADLRVESKARGEKVERVRAVVRAELDYLCREPHPSHDHVCPDDVRRSVLRALESEGRP